MLETLTMLPVNESCRIRQPVSHPGAGEGGYPKDHVEVEIQVQALRDFLLIVYYPACA